MSLISLQFVLFLVVLLVAYYGVGRLFGRGQWLVLLAGSFAFYALAAGWQLFALVLVIAGITWAGALGLQTLDAQAASARKAAETREERKALKARFTARKRIVLIAGLAGCIVVLGYFKYWNTILNYLRLAPSTDSLGIILPLGISFYTFQSLGYLIDVYNNTVEAERSFARHLLFVSWFPQVIQGPINRYAELAPQFFELRSPSGRRIERAFLRFGYGVIKKVAIANTVGGTVVATLNSATPAIPGSVAVVGVVAYAIQMYADFSGGIDMVEGVSELFGIELAQNFRQPYFSVSLADYWRRWHMSLGAWMRTYVFYPLAVTKPMQNLGKWARKHLPGQAGRTLPAAIANVAVFLLVGIWHGAELHYVAWGLYNGVIVALSDVLAPTFERISERLGINRAGLAWRIFSMVRTFIVVSIGRFFDYIASVALALAALRNIFTNFMPMPLEDALAQRAVLHIPTLGIAPVAIIGCIFVFCVSLAYERGTDVRESVLEWRFPARLVLYVCGALLVAASFGFDTVAGRTFLYANF